MLEHCGSNARTAVHGEPGVLEIDIFPAFRSEKELHCHLELQRSTLRSEKCWQSAEKLIKKTYAKKRNNRSAKIIALQKNWQRGPRGLFRRCETSNSDAYSHFRDQTRSEPEVVTILLTVSSMAAFFISSHSPRILWPLWAHKKGTMCAVKS